MSGTAQRTFADGEIAPALYARTDATKYVRGLRRCRNMIVLRHGGATNRPGTVFVKEAKDSAFAVRIIEFVLDSTNIEDTYLLEFGQRYLRFYQAAARVLYDASAAAWVDATVYAQGDIVSHSSGGPITYYYCLADHTSTAASDEPDTGTQWNTYWYPLDPATQAFEIPTPYDVADLRNINYKQFDDTITLVCAGKPSYELTRVDGGASWVLAPVVLGPPIAAPSNLAVTGGTAGDDIFWAVTAVMEGTLEESLAAVIDDAIEPSGANPVVITWDAVPGARSYNVYGGVDGLTYGLIQAAGGTAIAESDTAWTDTNEVASSAVAGSYVAAAGQLRNALATISVTNRAQDGNYTVKFKSRLNAGLAAVGISDGGVNVYYLRNTDAARVFAGFFSLDQIDGPGASGFLPREVTINVPDDGYTSLQIDVVPLVRPADGGATVSFTIDSSTAPSNAVEWFRGATGFTDAGADPDFTIGPPTQQTLFATPTDYPEAVTDYQQRRIFANTPAKRQTAWASRTASQSSFARSKPLQADDMVSFTLVGGRAQVIKHLMDLEGLIAFTTAGVHQVLGDGDGILRPDAVNPKRIAQNGISNLRPLEVDKSAIYVQARATVVRDLVPVETGGGLGSYRGTNLSIYSEHLFKGFTIVDCAYAEEPFGVCWFVRSDGVLLGLTYLRDFGVWGWHRHDTDGTVENVAVVPEGEEDALYLVVKRTINGSTKRYIERLSSRTFSADRDFIFMDAAITVDGRHTGATTMALSGGAAWDSSEQLTLTASGAFFVVGDVGNAIHLVGADGSLVRCTIESYTSATVVKVRADRAVPIGMQAVAIGNGAGSWGKAVLSVTGLTHLAGCAVAVLGDGFVVATPNNPTYVARRVTAGGVLTLPEPFLVIQIGLPYVSDIETLDLDGPGRTTKDTKKLVTKVGLFLEDSRGVWAGRADKWSADAVLTGLEELKSRQDEDYDDPPERVTDWREVVIGNDWESNGRVLVRQPDPLPMTVLSVSPIGYGV